MRFTVPSTWTKVPSASKAARNPAVEYTCPRAERTYKHFKLLTVDLSAATVPLPQAIEEFVQHYRLQIAKSSASQPVSGALFPD